MTEIQHVALADPHPTTWLRTAGVAAIVAAALGSIFFATPAMPEPPSTGTSCTTDVGGNWVFRNCEGAPEVSAP